MELKPYQKTIIADVDRYLGYAIAEPLEEAFHHYWFYHPRHSVTPYVGQAVEPYKDTVKGVPHVCVKVPTAGGKTFIACNALRTIFGRLEVDQYRLVVWLVPSVAILEQTIKNLRNAQHPYRQRIAADFGGRIEVVDKQDALMGKSFTNETVREHLTILVMSFDSFRTNNKEGRKVYQDNGNLQSFGQIIKRFDSAFIDSTDCEVQLMKVIQALQPVVIVDESHNAESQLSVEMLQNLNARFILDLTATPRKNSNIISFTDAIELKRENMVKLPVIVQNQMQKEDVIANALFLRQNLEEEARRQGSPIRPIVLFQAQPRTANDNHTFDRIKSILLEKKIPEEQIKIKTSERNELKGIDLMQSECPVRYIITVNALKEGWDCPNAYILASLADKNSAVDVEQILGRVLRLPYVRRNASAKLNSCYVLTASNQFMQTLQNIVKGLNRAGFSEKDARISDVSAAQQPTPKPQHQPEPKPEQKELFEDNSETAEEDIDPSKIAFEYTDDDTATEQPPTIKAVEEILNTAQQESEELDRKIEEATSNNQQIIPENLKTSMKTYKVKASFAALVEHLRLPVFYRPKDIYENLLQENVIVPLESNMLLSGFKLSKKDADISFDSSDDQIYEVDLDETHTDYTPSFKRLPPYLREDTVAYMRDPAHRGQRMESYKGQLRGYLGDTSPIPPKEVDEYLRRVLEGLTEEQINSLENDFGQYAQRIKIKVELLKKEYVKEEFFRQLENEAIQLTEYYQFPMEIHPSSVGKSISGSLYEREGEFNDFEARVIDRIASLPNVEFWTRNPSRTGFCINGYINHYPDFIIKTKQGKIVVLETKGEHLLEPDKVLLGNKWASMAGTANYRYYMVYENRKVEGAKTVDEFINVMKNL